MNIYEVSGYEPNKTKTSDIFKMDSRQSSFYVKEFMSKT